MASTFTPASRRRPRMVGAVRPWSVQPRQSIGNTDMCVNPPILAAVRRSSNGLLRTLAAQSTRRVSEAELMAGFVAHAVRRAAEPPAASAARRERPSSS
jgi:hypothetical protein